jgi:hypothetical protein
MKSSPEKSDPASSPRPRSRDVCGEWRKRLRRVEPSTFVQRTVPLVVEKRGESLLPFDRLLLLLGSRETASVIGAVIRAAIGAAGKLGREGNWGKGCKLRSVSRTGSTTRGEKEGKTPDGEYVGNRATIELGEGKTLPLIQGDVVARMRAFRRMHL